MRWFGEGLCAFVCVHEYVCEIHSCAQSKTDKNTVERNFTDFHINFTACQLKYFNMIIIKSFIKLFLLYVFQIA